MQRSLAGGPGWMLRQNVGYPEVARFGSQRVPLVDIQHTAGLNGHSRTQQ